MSFDDRLCCGTLPSDVLSNLPGNVVDHILVRLPLQDAVRTSILSKKWRYTWCRIPELTLDQALWGTTDNSIALTTRFTGIMFHLLALHVGPITKFTLSISNPVNCPKIDSLVPFLSRIGIQHLVLQFSKENPYKLPSSLFTCSEMKHLLLQNCLISPPPTFKGFNKLVSLKLYEVTISSEMLGKLISGSPLLEQVVLQISSISDQVQINAPKLRSFDFTGKINLISLKKTHLLVKLHLVNTKGWHATESDLVNFFEPFPALEHLYFEFSLFEIPADPDDVPEKLPSPLNSLKYLCLSAICLHEVVELKYALCLIKSSPYLQEIDIQLLEMSNPLSEKIEAALGSIGFEHFSDMTLNHLREVKLKRVTGTRPEMAVIKLLLAKSPMLIRMIIEHGKFNNSPEARLGVVVELTKFPRLSPRAEVVYKVT